MERRTSFTVITALIFAAGAHRERAELAASALARQGFRPVIAFDESDAVATVCGYPTVTTNFPRAGNLRGGLCLAGMLALLAEKQGSEKCILKVDADSLLLDSVPLLAPLLDPGTGARVSGFASRTGQMRGAVYALDAVTVAPAVIPECRRRTSTAYPEAGTLAELAKAAGHGVSLLPFGALAEPLRIAPLPPGVIAVHCGLSRDPVALMRAAMPAS